MGNLYGKYRGEVINAKDVDKLGRVLVTVPSLGDMELGWAECCLPPGMYTIPKRGDFVWVEFEEGNIDKPIWVGIMPTRDYFKELIGNNAETDMVIKSAGKVNVSSKRDTTFVSEGKVGLNSKGAMTLLSDATAEINGKSSTSVKSSGAVNVTGSSLVNSKKWSIDDIGKE